MFGGKLGIPELLVILVVLVVYASPWVIPWWRIFTKAGHSGALSLTMLIPVVNFGVLLWFAFSRWPIEDQRRL